MKFALILAILFFTRIDCQATVWDKKLSAIPPQEHANSYSLNEAELVISNGRTRQSLDRLLQTFLTKAQGRKAHYFSTQAAGRLISCALDPLTEKKINSPVEILQNVYAQCLFARSRQDLVHYQKVTLRGLPLPANVRSLSFAGLSLQISKEEQPLHLLPHDARGLAALALKQSSKHRNALVKLRSRFKQNGWSEIDMPGSQSFYLTRGEETVLGREEKDQLILIHAKGS